MLLEEARQIPVNSSANAKVALLASLGIWSCCGLPLLVLK